MEEWKIYKLGDLVNFRRGHDLPKSCMVEGDIPVAGSNGVIGYHNISTPVSPCITIGRSGNIGKPFYYDVCWAHNTTLYIDDFKGNDPLYIYYLLQTLPLAEFGGGSAVPTLNRNHIHPLEIKATRGINIQRRIAKILKSIDDRIELNRRINDNLEQQAQALFKSWFVDFEPFKNGRFVESELGMTPEGWRVVELGEVTIEQKRKVGDIENVKVLSPVNSGELQLSEEYFTKQVFSQSLSKYILVNPKDFAYNPARVNIGSLGMNTFDFVGCVSPVYVVFRCETEYEYFFDLYRHRQLFKEEVIARSIGGVRQTLGYKDFSMIKLIYPPKEIVQSFNTLYHSLLNNQERIKIENREMAEIRDSILPRLMSGELKIKDLNC